jgi:hypothetical protein
MEVEYLLEVDRMRNNPDIFLADAELPRDPRYVVGVRLDDQAVRERREPRGPRVAVRERPRGFQRGMDPMEPSHIRIRADKLSTRDVVRKVVMMEHDVVRDDDVDFSEKRRELLLDLVDSRPELAGPLDGRVLVHRRVWREAPLAEARVREHSARLEAVARDDRRRAAAREQRLQLALDHATQRERLQELGECREDGNSSHRGFVLLDDHSWTIVVVSPAL